MLPNILKLNLLLCYFSMVPSQAKFIRLIFDYCYILIWMLTHLSFDFEKYYYFRNLRKSLKAINVNIILINPYNTESRHEDETDMPNLLYVSRSKAFMATATKENISLVKEVFNGRPLDYSIICNVMCYDI